MPNEQNWPDPTNPGVPPNSWTEGPHLILDEHGVRRWAWWNAADGGARGGWNFSGGGGRGLDWTYVAARDGAGRAAGALGFDANMPPEWHPTLFYLQMVGYWQTLLAGVFAVFAAGLTIWATVRSADREIDAANRQIDTARRQIEITLTIDRRRALSERHSFLVAVEAAAGVVVDNVQASRLISMVPVAGPTTLSPAVYQARQRVSCPLFPELRLACVRFGGDLTASFVQLDQQISAFAADWVLSQSNSGMTFRNGPSAGFHDGLTSIEARAKTLRWRPYSV